MAKDSWPFYTHWEPRFIGILNNAPLVDLVDLAGSSITTTIIDTIMCIIMSKWGRGGEEHGYSSVSRVVCVLWS